MDHVIDTLEHLLDTLHAEYRKCPTIQIEGEDQSVAYTRSCLEAMEAFATIFLAYYSVLEQIQPDVLADIIKEFRYPEWYPSNIPTYKPNFDRMMDVMADLHDCYVVGVKY